jgi:cysteine desulfurase / selenocysteine lyase
VNSRIYLDNAATSFPKPAAVHAAMSRYATELGASPGRGAYAEAREGGRILAECRELLCRLFGGEDPDHVIFTLNASDALNLAIHGLVRPGDHVVTTCFEHNSVLRPLRRLAETEHVEVTRVECDPVTGLVDPDDLGRAIRPRTRLVAVVHGSNVTGTLQPVAEIGRITRERGIPFLVDAAQSAGHVPLDVRAAGIDLLAFPGHKGLLGPLGTGALYLRPGIEKELCTVREGGTGSASDQDVQPDWLPDRFEPGSYNALGIAGWLEGVRWILERGTSELRQHEERLMRAMLAGLDGIPGLALYGPRTLADRVGVFSVRLPGFSDPQALSARLESDFGLLTRSGIHCAPLAHRTIGTANAGGTTRFSLGPFVTERDVAIAVEALGELARESGRARATAE